MNRTRRERRSGRGDKQQFANREAVTVASWLVAVVALVAGTILSTRWVFAIALDVTRGDPPTLVTPVSAWAAMCWLVLATGVWLGSKLERKRVVTPQRPSAERTESRMAQRRQQRRKAAGEDGSRLFVRSRVYTRWLYLHVVLWVLITGHLIGAAATLWRAAFAKTPAVGSRMDLVVVAGVLLIVAAAWVVPASLVKRTTRRLAARHDRVAHQIRSLTERRGWVYSDAASVDLDALAAPPFSRVVGLTAWPSARRTDGVRLDAAWLAGDFGPALLPYRSFTSRAMWVHLPRPLAQVDFVPERFTDSIVKLLGGTDVDVESYAFNKRWRVNAVDVREAHGILQPRMIEFLNGIDDEGVAFHVAGPSIVIWDDGKDENVDLGARADLLDEFVARLPGHLRTPE